MEKLNKKVISGGMIVKIDNFVFNIEYLSENEYLAYCTDHGHQHGQTIITKSDLGYYFDGLLIEEDVNQEWCQALKIAERKFKIEKSNGVLSGVGRKIWCIVGMHDGKFQLWANWNNKPLIYGTRKEARQVLRDINSGKLKV